MARKFDISFKEITKEKKLFNYFFDLEDRGNVIKSILWEWYKINIEGIEENKKTLIVEEKKNKLDMDITNF